MFLCREASGAVYYNIREIRIDNGRSASTKITKRGVKWLLIALSVVVLVSIIAGVTVHLLTTGNMTEEFVPGHTLATMGYDVTTLQAVNRPVFDAYANVADHVWNPHTKERERTAGWMSGWKARSVCELKTRVRGYTASTELIQAQREHGQVGHTAYNLWGGRG